MHESERRFNVPNRRPDVWPVEIDAGADSTEPLTFLRVPSCDTSLVNTFSS